METPFQQHTIQQPVNNITGADMAQHGKTPPQQQHTVPQLVHNITRADRALQENISRYQSNLIAAEK